MSLKVQYSSLQTGIKVQLNFTPADPTFNFPLQEYSFVIVFQVNLLSVNQLSDGQFFDSEKEVKVINNMNH